jgi:hypothetical protein
MHSANRSATKSSAVSHDTFSRLGLSILPALRDHVASRISGYRARPACADGVIVRCSVEPLLQSFPALEG